MLRHTDSILLALPLRLEVGKWSMGHPVFKKVEGASRFLFVPRGKTAWSIRESTNGFSRPVGKLFMTSGKATNSPSSPEAGASARLGFSRWQYWDGGKWNEGFISVTCK